MEVFKIGDKVIMSDSREKGKIVAIGHKIKVLLDFGLDIECFPKEIVHDISLVLPNKLKINAAGKPIYTRKDDNKKSNITDLHLSDSQALKIKLENGSSIQNQLKKLQLTINENFIKRNLKLIIIHGEGSGKLRAAVQDYLSTHPQVLGFKPANVWDFANGALEVSLR